MMDKKELVWRCRNNTQWMARINIFRDVFPWVIPSIKEAAGLDAGVYLGPAASHEGNRVFNEAFDEYVLGMRSEREEIKAIHVRANREWTELTGIPALGVRKDWRTAACAAGISPSDFDATDFVLVVEYVTSWAIARRVERDRGEPPKLPANATTDVLTPKQENILKALIQFVAFASDKRRTAAYIANAVTGAEATNNEYKGALRELVKAGFLHSQRSAGGGYWLTCKGRQFFDR